MMVDPYSVLENQCLILLTKAVKEVFPGNKIPEIRFSRPPKIEMGMVSSTISFQLARKINSNPKDIAKEIVNKIDYSLSELVSKAEAINGYINFHTNYEAFGKYVLTLSKKLNQDYGFVKTERAMKVMVEHTSANPIGPIHVGNARNSIVGDSLAKMIKYRGHDVAVHFLVNDMGRQVALTTYGWQLLGKPKPEGRSEVWVGTIYASLNILLEIQKIQKALVEATSKGWEARARAYEEEMLEYAHAAEELKERNQIIYSRLEKVLKEIEEPYVEIAALNTSYENGDSQTTEDVRTLVGYCLEGFEESLGEIGISFDSFDFESNLVWDKKAENVLEELKKTKYVFYEEGATILDCDAIATDFDLKKRWDLNPNHEIPRLVLIRSDGTTLYTLRDIAYSIEKFGLVDRVINVIGYEQILAQLQLRISLAALDKTWMGDNQTHFSYEHVKLPDIRMSGRLGRYVTLIDVLQKAVELAYNEVEKRMSHLSQGEKEEIAKKVGYGAVKYTLLSVDPMKTVVFEWDKALNFETNSAPFIQYSHARACNILKRVRDEPKPDFSLLVDVKEKRLISTISEWPGIFVNAVEELKPGLITSYSNVLADRFNSFYASLHVLNAEKPGLRGARVELVNATRIVLRNALNVIGIDAPEIM